jgi:glucosamine-6-phosphate deaminase
MRIVLDDNYEDMSRTAARHVVELVVANPRAKIVVPTGNTPVGMFREIARLAAEKRLNFNNITVFQLDAYVGVRDDDPRSLYGWMDREFLQPLGIGKQQVVRFDQLSRYLDRACRAFDAKLDEMGPLDLAVLGLGPNGHLGFNEPPADSSSVSRVVTLPEESIRSNAVYWGSAARVPRTAVTMGMRQLLRAKVKFLLVSGAGKQDILSRTLKGPVTANVPASFLQTAGDVTVFADRLAWPDHG